MTQLTRADLHKLVDRTFDPPGSSCLLNGLAISSFKTDEVLRCLLSLSILWGQGGCLLPRVHCCLELILGSGRKGGK